jgi:hypothetical protein
MDYITIYRGEFMIVRIAYSIFSTMFIISSRHLDNVGYMLLSLLPKYKRRKS